ncbi:MAG: hypothetical protein ACQEQL_04355 [Pseudomonadota bacterium]
MTDFLIKHFHTGHLKAYLVALPALLFYGLLIFILWDRGVIEEIGQFNVFWPSIIVILMIVTPGLGLLGLWAAFLFQPRLDGRYGRLNKIVAGLLTCGALGIFGSVATLLVGMIMTGESQLALQTLPFLPLPVGMVVYIIFMIRRVLHKRKPAKGPAFAVKESQKQ